MYCNHSRQKSWDSQRCHDNCLQMFRRRKQNTIIPTRNKIDSTVQFTDCQSHCFLPVWKSKNKSIARTKAVASCFSRLMRTESIRSCTMRGYTRFATTVFSKSLGWSVFYALSHWFKCECQSAYRRCFYLSRCLSRLCCLTSFIRNFARASKTETLNDAVCRWSLVSQWRRSRSWATSASLFLPLCIVRAYTKCKKTEHLSTALIRAKNFRNLNPPIVSKGSPTLRPDLTPQASVWHGQAATQGQAQ